MLDLNLWTEREMAIMAYEFERRRERCACPMRAVSACTNVNKFKIDPLVPLSIVHELGDWTLITSKNKEVSKCQPPLSMDVSVHRQAKFGVVY